MACSIPPMYWSTGIQWTAAAGSKGTSGLNGSQKRRKYQLESTKVSMVSVSRSAGPPQIGQVVRRKPSFEARGDLPGRQELDVVGGQHRELVLGHRHHAVVRAVDDGDRAAPVALPRHQPVPQAVVDLGRAQPLALEELDGPGLGGGDVQAVEEAAVDLLAVAGVGAAPALVPSLGRPHGADDGQAVGLGEGPVALVLGRHGHDGPGAVAHEHVVGHVDRHRLAGERVDARGCR